MSAFMKLRAASSGAFAWDVHANTDSVVSSRVNRVLGIVAGLTVLHLGQAVGLGLAGMWACGHVGMRACGVHASTTIEAVSLMMKAGHSVRELAELFHPHPAVTEAVQDCVRMLLGNSIYKPEVFTSDLRLSRVEFEQPDLEEVAG